VTLTEDVVLVCQSCGTQQEVPAISSSMAATPTPWVKCIKYGCGSTKFSLRMRVPIVKSEPAP
jgi:hypothetical protein